MKDIMKIFNDYAKTFELKNKNIMRKFHHSYRVMDFSIEIAKSLDLNEEDIRVIGIAGLFHDIARFEQWTQYETYVDSKSFDHGDMGYNILKEKFIDEFGLNENEQEIVLKAVKNHNKFKVEDNIEGKELLICNIIRDADKLDIMKEQGFITKEDSVKDELVNLLLEHKVVANDLVETEMDSLFRLIAFIFDLNFEYSFKYLLHKKIIENKINLIEIYGNKDLSNLQDNLINYMKGRLEC